jgi:hypothetical protein
MTTWEVSGGTVITLNNFGSTLLFDLSADLIVKSSASSIQKERDALAVASFRIHPSVAQAQCYISAGKFGLIMMLLKQVV